MYLICHNIKTQKHLHVINKFRSSRSQMFFKIDFLKIFANSIGKHLCWSIFLKKVAGPQDYSFIKRRFQHRCFPVKFAKLRSSHSEMFLVKDVLKICSKFTEKHPYQNVISIKLLHNFIEITLLHGCSPVNFAAYSYSEHLLLKTPLDSYF